jgi:hypothetical protein
MAAIGSQHRALAAVANRAADEAAQASRSAAEAAEAVKSGAPEDTVSGALQNMSAHAEEAQAAANMVVDLAGADDRAQAPSVDEIAGLIKSVTPSGEELRTGAPEPKVGDLVKTILPGFRSP